MQDFLIHIGWLTLSMSSVILLVLLWSKICGKKFSAKSRYIVWVVVVLSLCIGIGLFKLPSPFMVEVTVPPFMENIPSVPEQTPTPVDTQPPRADLLLTPTPSAPTVPTTPTSPADPSTPTDTVPASPISNTTEKTARSFHVAVILFGIWAAGAAVFLVVSLAVYVRSTHKYTRGKVVCSADTEAVYRAVCAGYGIKRAPSLYACPAVGSPILYGYAKPTILLPEMELTKNSLVGILTHELTHYRRGDIWIKLICLLAESLYWFNPLVHLAAARCNVEMELSCDEKVLAGMNEDVRRSYGNVMLNIVEHCSNKRSLLTTQFNPHKRAVKERIMNILDVTKKRHGTVIIAVVLVLCIVAGTVIGCGVTNRDGTSGESTPIFEEELPGLMERYLLHEKYTVYSSLCVDDSVKDESGMYFKVSDEAFDTWEEWTSFIASIFAGDALTAATPDPRGYKNIDGYTYCAPGDMGWYISGEYSYEILEQDAEGALVLISRYEIEPGEDAGTEKKRTWQFHFGLTEDGWRIFDITSSASHTDSGNSGAETGGPAAVTITSGLEERVYEGGHRRYIRIPYVMTNSAHDSTISRALTDDFKSILQAYLAGEADEQRELIIDYTTEADGDLIGIGVFAKLSSPDDTHLDTAFLYMDRKTDTLFTLDEYLDRANLRAEEIISTAIEMDGTLKEANDIDLAGVYKRDGSFVAVLKAEDRHVFFDIDTGTITSEDDFIGFGIQPAAPHFLKNTDGLVSDGYTRHFTFKSPDPADSTQYFFDICLPHIDIDKENARVLNKKIEAFYLERYADPLTALGKSPERYGNNGNITYKVAEYGDILILCINDKSGIIASGAQINIFDVYYYDMANDQILTDDAFIRIYTDGAVTLSSLIAEMNTRADVINVVDTGHSISEEDIYGVVPTDNGDFYLIYQGYAVEGLYASGMYVKNGKTTENLYSYQLLQCFGLYQDIRFDITPDISDKSENVNT